MNCCLILSYSCTHLTETASGPLLSTNICLLWDRAFNDEVVVATFRSLARSYTQPFLLIMSNEKWSFRSQALLKDFFSHVQVVGMTEHFTFRGGTSGDRLIFAYVGSPLDSVLDDLPPLDESSPSVNDICRHRFDSRVKLHKEIERFISECDAPFKRQRVLHVPFDNSPS